MKKHFDELLALLTGFPVHYSPGNAETVKAISVKYGKILSLLMKDDYYFGQAADFPDELAEIDAMLKNAIYGKSEQEEDFFDAMARLKRDIKELAEMIDEQEGFS